MATIKGKDIVKHSGGFVPPSFRQGKYMTEKDRPRKKYKPNDFLEEELWVVFFENEKELLSFPVDGMEKDEIENTITYLAQKYNVEESKIEFDFEERTFL